jgi:hypothetical protein
MAQAQQEARLAEEIARRALAEREERARRQAALKQAREEAAQRAAAEKERLEQEAVDRARLAEEERACAASRAAEEAARVERERQDQLERERAEAISAAEARLKWEAEAGEREARRLAEEQYLRAERLRHTLRALAAEAKAAGGDRRSARMDRGVERLLYPSAPNQPGGSAAASERPESTEGSVSSRTCRDAFDAIPTFDGPSGSDADSSDDQAQGFSESSSDSDRGSGHSEHSGGVEEETQQMKRNLWKRHATALKMIRHFTKYQRHTRAQQAKEAALAREKQRAQERRERGFIPKPPPQPTSMEQLKQEELLLRKKTRAAIEAALTRIRADNQAEAATAEAAAQGSHSFASMEAETHALYTKWLSNADLLKAKARMDEHTRHRLVVAEAQAFEVMRRKLQSDWGAKFTNTHEEVSVLTSQQIQDIIDMHTAEAVELEAQAEARRVKRAKRKAKRAAIRAARADKAAEDQLTRQAQARETEADVAVLPMPVIAPVTENPSKSQGLAEESHPIKQRNIQHLPHTHTRAVLKEAMQPAPAPSLRLPNSHGFRWVPPATAGLHVGLDNVGPSAWHDPLSPNSLDKHYQLEQLYGARIPQYLEHDSTASSMSLDLLSLPHLKSEKLLNNVADVMRMNMSDAKSQVKRRVPLSQSPAKDFADLKKEIAPPPPDSDEELPPLAPAAQSFDVLDAFGVILEQQQQHSQPPPPVPKAPPAVLQLEQASPSKAKPEAAAPVAPGVEILAYMEDSSSDLSSVDSRDLTSSAESAAEAGADDAEEEPEERPDASTREEFLRRAVSFLDSSVQRPQQVQPSLRTRKAKGRAKSSLEELRDLMHAVSNPQAKPKAITSHTRIQHAKPRELLAPLIGSAAAKEPTPAMISAVRTASCVLSGWFRVSRSTRVTHSACLVF